MYQFNKQLGKGEEAERQLDDYFSQWFTIRKATRAQQRQGIDRIFRSKATGTVLTIEYKTDWTAGKTGNAFVETISVDTANRKGWAYTAQADVLLYYIPANLLVYWMTFRTLRTHLLRWVRNPRLYPVRQIPNRGYHTHGILVPLCEFEEHAEHVISL